MTKKEDMDFLRALARWDGIASSRDLGCVVDRKEDRARQRCRRLGLVTFDGYWRLTEAGRSKLLEPVGADRGGRRD